MTMVGAFIADDGIAFIGDGRVNSMAGEIISDTQVKLFELSDICVLLPANGASDNIEQIMRTLRTLNVIEGLRSIDRVANSFLEYCRQYVETVPGGRVNPIFTLAGYNFLSDGSYVPHIYVLQYERGEWQVYALNRQESHFIVNAPRRSELEEYVINEASKRGNSLEAANQLAVDALLLAERQSPQAVGGRTSLWNLVPPDPISKLSYQKISALRRKSTV